MGKGQWSTATNHRPEGEQVGKETTRDFSSRINAIKYVVKETNFDPHQPQ